MQIITLLVPHDGSWMADRVLAYAAILQDATGGRLDVLRLEPDGLLEAHVQSRVPPGAGNSQDDASAIDQGADLSAPATIIRDAIERCRPDLVVMASETWSTIGLGVEVTRQVARCSSAPILVIPTNSESPRRDLDVRRVLVALDGSEQAEQALAPAQMLADALEGDMLLLRVMTAKVGVGGGRAPDDGLDLAGARRYVEDLARQLQASRSRVSALAVVGDPGTMISTVSRTQRASLLAMTTRGNGALSSFGLGSIAESSLQSSTLPLLLVPPDARVGRTARSRASASKG